NYWMTQHPEYATVVGYPGQDARWTDYSASSIADRENYLKTSLKRLLRIDRNELTSEDRITFDLYRDSLETAVEGLQFHNEALPIKGVIPHNLAMPMNQMEGIQQEIPHVLAVMRTATAQDYENILSRLEGVGALVDQTIALMEQGLTAGMTPPKVALRGVL